MQQQPRTCPSPRASTGTIKTLKLEGCLWFGCEPESHPPLPAIRGKALSSLPCDGLPCLPHTPRANTAFRRLFCSASCLPLPRAAETRGSASYAAL